MGRTESWFFLRTTLGLCWWQSLEIERQEHFLGAVGSFHTHQRQGLSCARWGKRGWEPFGVTFRSPIPNPKLSHLRHRKFQIFIKFPFKFPFKFQLNPSAQNEDTKKADEFVGKGLFGLFWEMVARRAVLGLRNLIVPKLKLKADQVGLKPSGILKQISRSVLC